MLQNICSQESKYYTSISTTERSYKMIIYTCFQQPTFGCFKSFPSYLIKWHRQQTNRNISENDNEYHIYKLCTWLPFEYCTFRNWMYLCCRNFPNNTSFSKYELLKWSNLVKWSRDLAWKVYHRHGGFFSFACLSAVGWMELFCGDVVLQSFTKSLSCIITHRYGDCAMQKSKCRANEITRFSHCIGRLFLVSASHRLLVKQIDITAGCIVMIPTPVDPSCRWWHSGIVISIPYLQNLEKLLQFSQSVRNQRFNHNALK